MRTRSLLAALTSRHIAKTLSSPLPVGSGILASTLCTTPTTAGAASHRPTFPTTTTTTTTSTSTTIMTSSSRGASSSVSVSVPEPETANPIAAVAQLRSTSDKFRNLVDIAVCAGLARAKGASMLFLPECFGFMGESAAQTLQEAEDPARLSTSAAEDSEDAEALDRILKATIASASANSNASSEELPQPGGGRPTVPSLMDGLRIIARESGLWISGGGIHVAGAPPLDGDEANPPRVYNTHVVMDSEGTVRASYRKIHLFDVSIPGKVELRESKTTAPGTELVVCDSPLGRLGVTICYDLRFPETYTRLVEEMGARILLVPSAFTVPTGAAHWHALLRARAIENQCYVLAAAQYGIHNAKRDSFGRSLAVDPWGKILADAGGYPTTEEADAGALQNGEAPEPPSIVTVEIDLGLIDSIRERMPIDLHRSNATF